MRPIAVAAGLLLLGFALPGCESSINSTGGLFCPGPDCPDQGFLTDDSGQPVLDDAGQPKPKPDTGTVIPPKQDAAPMRSMLQQAGADQAAIDFWSTSDG